MKSLAELQAIKDRMRSKVVQIGRASCRERVCLSV